LTTDGRIFSWGANTHCLGRHILIANQGQTIGGMPLGGDQITQAAKIHNSVDIGEIDFSNQNCIVKIACGLSHVAALDT
jgi:alpha-tubulin suppressor-like RCC1 family protein